MKIYFPHSKQLEYESLYRAIRASAFLAKHTCILPYEKNVNPQESKSIIKDCDLVIAEVSYPGTGLGIELGWAEGFGKRIICIYKYDFHIAGSLKYVSEDFISYLDFHELMEKLETAITELD